MAGRLTYTQSARIFCRDLVGRAIISLYTLSMPEGVLLDMFFIVHDLTCSPRINICLVGKGVFVFCGGSS